MLSVLSLLSGLIIITLLKNTHNTDTAVGLTILLFSIAVIFDIVHNRIYRRYFIPIILSYFGRILLLFYDVYSDDPLGIPLIGGPLTSDPYYFYQAAVLTSQGFKVSYGTAFTKMLGWLFRLTGPSRLLGEFVVLLFSIGTILVTVKILDSLDVDSRSKFKGCIFICLLPNYALLSALLRRETVITFFLALSVMYYLRWFTNKGKEKDYVLAIVFALCASLFHGGSGLIIAGYIFYRFIYSPKQGRFTLNMKNVLAATILVILIAFVFARYGSLFFSKVDARLAEGNYASVREAGGSSYARYVGDANTPIRMILFAIPRFIYFMFSPLPWQWRGIQDILTFLMSSLVYLFVYIDTIRYIVITPKNSKNRSIIISVLIILILIAFIYSWGVTNTGTATRHRDKFVCLYTILYTLSRRKQKWKLKI